MGPKKIVSPFEVFVHTRSRALSLSTSPASLAAFAILDYRASTSAMAFTRVITRLRSWVMVR